MARPNRRGSGKLTAKQDEVRKLIEGGQSIVEVAELMETTPGAVKAQISRIRKLGVAISTSTTPKPPTPTPTRKRRGRKAPKPAAASDELTPVRPRMSIEEHVGAELTRIEERLATVGETLTNLTAEQGNLSDRKGRLEAARAELTPGSGNPALAVVA